MPTIDAKVNASADDAYEYSGNTFIADANLLNIDNTDEWGGLILRGITTGEDAVFSEGHLSVYLPTSTADEPDIRIYGLAAATPAAFTAGLGSNISSRARTTAYVDWANTGLGAPGFFDSPDISTILQELQDAYGPYANWVMGFVFTSRANDDTRDFLIAAWDNGDHSYAAELHATFTLGANASPTIVLDTPDATIFTDSTPALEFTGSDADADDLRYQIQISDGADFYADGVVMTDGMDVAASAGAGGLHSNGSGYLTWQGEYQADDRFGMSFTGAGGLLDKVAFICETDTTETDGYAIARVYAHQGTFGTSSEPLNPAEPADTPTPNWLAESAAVYFDTTLSRSWQEFTFSGANRVRLQYGVHYVVILDWQPNTGAYSNALELSQVAIPAHAGNAYIDGLSVANNGIRLDFDVYFQVYEDHLLIDAVSGTDAGFTNTVTGGDADPFNPGEKINYTVQTALADSTYYWRARVIDPSGVNTWSDWTAAQSFQVALGLPPYVTDAVAHSETISAAMSGALMVTVMDANALTERVSINEINVAGGDAITASETCTIIIDGGVLKVGVNDSSHATDNALITVAAAYGTLTITTSSAVSVAEGFALTGMTAPVPPPKVEGNARYILYGADAYLTIGGTDLGATLGDIIIEITVEEYYPRLMIARGPISGTGSIVKAAGRITATLAEWQYDILSALYHIGHSTTANSEIIGSGALGVLTELSNIRILGITRNDGNEFRITMEQARVTSPIAANLSAKEVSGLEVTFEALYAIEDPYRFPMCIEIAK